VALAAILLQSTMADVIMYSLNNTKMTVTTYMECPWNIR